MSVKIRLQLLGSHKKPFYRIVAANSRNKRDGKFLEILGSYAPLRDSSNLNTTKIEKWISVGGQPTTIVKKLYKKFKNQK
ncbi:30S ribosomal protein S16 [Candidatus Phytoplasma melaleucae]|uniref:Small ribosomal subunit protein bS16 n=1 Tax=Candidatus Phytoplasma melaleucae TaxID=2982630 RepID=A0ABT9DDP9_9MOLU|nr:30S ribosomal protein S16 ['Melaleuca sp.' phytoplasma]MDO8168168.1 30S ribosomal protein S16 ['Melaleuca sp.' phytoplasma]MDV3205478.1 30S ribosomal protein S16 [Weeping tea tree witches'-broom phytoplasma]